MLDILVSELFNGIVLGSIYALVAMGLTIIWSIADVPDFAQGGIYVFAGYAAYFATTLFHIPYFLSIFLAILTAIAFSVFFDKYFYWPLRESPLSLLLVAIAFFFLLDNLAITLFTAKAKMLSSPLTNIIIYLGAMTVNAQRILIPVITIIVFIIINIVIKKTKIGIAIRAVAQDREAAALMGINISSIYILLFTIGGAATGLASSLVAPLYSVYPEMGTLPILKALVVVVLGGMGSFLGALVGGLLLGIIEAVGVTYVPVAWQHGFAFIILILVLVLKPSGLFGLKRE